MFGITVFLIEKQVGKKKKQPVIINGCHQRTDKLGYIYQVKYYIAIDNEVAMCWQGKSYTV